MSFTAPTILWAGLTPVAVILGAAVLGVLLEALVPRRARPVLQPALAVLAILGAGAGVVVRWRAVEAGVGASLATGFDEELLRRYDSGGRSGRGGSDRDRDHDRSL